MTIYRIFLLIFVAVSWGLLSGLKLPVKNDGPAMNFQKTTVELNLAAAENTGNPSETKKTVKGSSQKTKQKTTQATVDNRNELESPLDLSVPFKGAENGDFEKKRSVPSGVVNIFSTESTKNPGSLELEGGFLMSPEPQAEKRKSVDGAGIVINIKP